MTFAIAQSPEVRLAKEKLDGLNIDLNALIFADAARPVMKSNEFENGYKSAVLDCKLLIRKAVQTL